MLSVLTSSFPVEDPAKRLCNEPQGLNQPRCTSQPGAVKVRPRKKFFLLAAAFSGFLGASPDVHIGEDGIIEVTCPFQHTDGTGSFQNNIYF